MGICGNQSKLNVVLFAILIIILTTFLLCFVWVTFFADVKYVNTDPMTLGGHFQGDIVLRGGIQPRGVLRDERYRWPNKKVFYKFESNISVRDQATAVEAMREIESVSCVKFVPAGRDDADYVTITRKDEGCFSTIGYEKDSISNLGFGCWRSEIIIHEFLHTLGFLHQQNAPNRDDYIKIFEENVEDGQLYNFDKWSADDWNDFGLPYDYYSIMHYGPYFYSKNGKKTMVPIPDPNVKIGEALHLSKYDKIKLNKMYNCKPHKT